MTAWLEDIFLPCDKKIYCKSQSAKFKFNYRRNT